MPADVTDLFALSAAVGFLADEPERWPARHAEMIAVVLDELTRADAALAPALMRRLAARIVARQCAEYGGSREYWPKVDAIARMLRDAEIWAEHDGTKDGANGIAALARRHRLSEVQIWAILREQRALHQLRASGTAQG